MDEATSALDEDMQTSLMNLFTSELAGATLVSIAHRPALDAFHDRILTLVDAVGGARLVTKHKPHWVQVRQRRRSCHSPRCHGLFTPGDFNDEGMSLRVFASVHPEPMERSDLSRRDAIQALLAAHPIK
jgi:hypothetical protein